MKLKKIIMSDGNVYILVWDESNFDEEGIFEMWDIEKGKVQLNAKFISQMLHGGILNDQTPLHPLIRKGIIDEKGEEVFYEEENLSL